MLESRIGAEYWGPEDDKRKHAKYIIRIPASLADEMGYYVGQRLKLSRGPGSSWLLGGARRHGLTVKIRCGTDRRFLISLPKALVEFLGYRKGDMVKWCVRKNKETFESQLQMLMPETRSRLQV